MIPTIEWVLSHLTADLFEGTTIFMHLVEDLAIAIVTAFHLPQNPLWWRLAIFMVEIDDVVHVVHVHNESSHALRDFTFRISHIFNDLSHHCPNELNVIRYTLEVDGVGMLGLSHYLPFLVLIVPLPVSARLNSLATFVGMPTFLANAGLWAAAAIVPACLADLEGIWFLLI